VVGEADLLSFLASRRVEVAAEMARGMLSDTASGKCTSRDLLRLVLTGDERAKRGSVSRGSATGSVTRLTN
jgi:hypothetical protein